MLKSNSKSKTALKRARRFDLLFDFIIIQIDFH